MARRQLMMGIGLMLMAGLWLSPCYADEITFKDENNANIGTVIEIDEETVTIRFSRESIKSIVMIKEGVPSPEKTGQLKSAPLTDPRFQEKIERVQERIERLEKKDEEYRKAGSSPTPPGPSKNGKTIDQLIREEMGSVEGLIVWKREPLRKGKVKIVLENYTGFSLASLKKIFSGKKKDPSDQEITLTTQTDSQGRYIFKKVPPGQYRFYWMPEEELEWIRRLREEPDFEVIAGKLTIQNIPGKKKK